MMDIVMLEEQETGFPLCLQSTFLSLFLQGRFTFFMLGACRYTALVPQLPSLFTKFPDGVAIRLYCL